MESILTEYLGWAATAVFVSSYFCTRPGTLRGVQMAGALMWILYGILIGASPVIVANALVFAAALWTVTTARSTPQSALKSFSASTVRGERSLR
jgi:hypothetical protein